MQVVEKVDPKGIGILTGWTWTFLKVWKPEEVQDCIRRLPLDRVRVVDFYSEQVPLYHEMDYFGETPWQFGILHAFGGETHLHGNMPLLKKQFDTVVEDRRAVNCVGFQLLNEVSGGNYFYYQFACKLGWNPSEVTLDSYTHEYAASRYGDRAAQPMREALQELLASVYGADEFSEPLYWHRLGSHFDASVYEGRPFVPHLRRALEHALKASESARTNALFLHDLNDMARAYLQQLFNAHVLTMVAAFRNLELETFEREAQLVENILETIEQLLSHDDYYWLSPSIRQARTLPGAPPDIDRRVRDILTLWGGFIHDYACRDVYEMVRGYYRPRVRAYIQELRTELANRQRYMEYGPGEARLEQQYDEIERKWVAEGSELLEGKGEPQLVVDTVSKILRTFRSAEPA
jgi:hypothetical protein